MKHLLFLAIAVIVCLTSCSTYKHAQTPDDVYYSPSAPDQSADYYSQPRNQGDYYSVPVSDQYVQLRVQNPDKWSYFDNYYDEGYGAYGYSSPSTYGFSTIGLSFGFGSFGYYSPFSYYNSYCAWNSYYNPYYYGTVIIANPKLSTPVAYTGLKPFNPGSYLGSHATRSGNTYVPYTRPGGQPAVSGNGFSNSMRRIFGSSSYSNGLNSNGQSIRTYSPSSFSGGGGGHVGGAGHVGGGGIGRPGR